MKPYKHIIEIETNSDNLKDTLMDMLDSFFESKYIKIRVEKNES